MTAPMKTARIEGSVKRAKTEVAGLLFAPGSAGPFAQLSRSIIEVWSCLDQESWARFSVTSKWMNWSAKFPGHGVHAHWIRDRPPGPSVVAQNVLRSVDCDNVYHRDPTGLIYASGCAAVAQLLGRCLALQKLTISLPYMSGRDVDNGNLAPLSLLVHLRELRVAESGLCSGEGIPLSGLDSLTTLSCLEVLELKPVDLAKLPTLASVSDLQIQPLDTKITEEMAQRLAWPSLTALSLEGGWLSAEATERLTRNGKLRRLEVMSFDMVAPAPSLVHVTVEEWSSVQPPSALVFHKGLSHLAVHHGWGAEEGTWCLCAPFMADPCPASLQSLELGSSWNQDTTQPWAFAQWITGASQSSLRVMDLDKLDYVLHSGFGLWLQGLKGLRRLQVGDLPDEIRLPQLHELSILGNRQSRIVHQLRNLPLWVPELRVLWLYYTDMNFDGHLLALLPHLRCLVLYDITEGEMSQVLDGILGCTCDCPATVVHAPKLRILRVTKLVKYTKAKWLLRANARNIVVTDNKEGWSLDHSVYTE